MSNDVFCILRKICVFGKLYKFYFLVSFQRKADSLDKKDPTKVAIVFSQPIGSLSNEFDREANDLYDESVEI